MSKRTNRSILIDFLLKLIAENPGITVEKLLDKLSQKYSKQEIASTLRYMKYNQLVFNRFERGLSVSNKAKIRLSNALIEQLFVTKPKNWDKKWRIIMYDIPENMKSKRDAFSKHLVRVKLLKLKDGVYIHPFPCQSEIEKLANYFQIQKHVTYIESSKLITNRKLEKEFEKLLS